MIPRDRCSVGGRMFIKELKAPPLAHTEGAQEVLRVWANDSSNQQIALQTQWQDPASWGLILVDVARHAAKAYAISGKYSESEAMQRIVVALRAELLLPTDAPKQLRS